jgi:hypothetical protein
MDHVAIKGERLTTWAVTQDGERVRLSFEDEAGRPCAISLPVSLLSGLMMTIPRMLRQALNARFKDNSLRMTHELGDWRVERAAGADASILSLATADGFEVTFAVAASQAEGLGKTLRQAADPATPGRALLN